MSQKHGTPLRGLMSTQSSPLFQGRFGRLFRSLHPAQFGSTEAENVANLTKLGQAMSAGFDGPKDGKLGVMEPLGWVHTAPAKSQSKT